MIMLLYFPLVLYIVPLFSEILSFYFFIWVPLILEALFKWVTLGYLEG